MLSATIFSSHRRRPKMENTFIMIKPDGVKRRLIGELIKRFEQKGLYLAEARCIRPSRELLEKHYEHLAARPFFDQMVQSMMSGMVFAMVWSGKDAVAVCRKVIGATSPSEAEMGSIRGDLGISVGLNVIHGSDSVERAREEIRLWFNEDAECAEPFDEELLH
jgi:nucleoside-diphosphate kinase